jgi:hypothetical protein
MFRVRGTGETGPVAFTFVEGDNDETHTGEGICRDRRSRWRWWPLYLLSATSAAAKEKQLDLALCAPDRNRFTLDIDNSFFPLPVGQQWVLFGIDEGQPVGLRITVLRETKNLRFTSGTVTTRVVEEVH